MFKVCELAKLSKAGPIRDSKAAEPARFAGVSIRREQLCLPQTQDCNVHIYKLSKQVAAMIRMVTGASFLI